MKRTFWDLLKQFFINLLISFTKKIKISLNTIQKADKNKDGYISLVEILEPFNNYKVVAKIINFIDKWLYMFVNVPLSKIKDLDEDKDGFVSIDEIWKYIKNLLKNNYDI